MINKVVMPKTGQTMETGTIVSWKAQVGDTVKKGDILLEIETDKATLEIEAFHSGQLKAIVAEEGREVPIEAVIALIGDESDTVDDGLIASLSGQGVAPQTSSATPTSEPAQASTAPASTGKVKISPRAKKLAEKLGVDITQLPGTGNGGRIVEKDVHQAGDGQPQAAAASPAPVPAGQGEFVPANRLRKLTAEKMIQSKQQIPCFYLNVKADVTDLFDRRQKANRTAAAKISFNDYIINAIGQALVKHPHMTGQWTGDGIKLAESFGVGLAISSSDGLVAPVVQNVETKSLEDIAVATQDLIDKAQTNKLAPTDLEGASITLSNLGMMGIDEFIPIVVPGQASILGVGRINDQCVPQMGGMRVQKIMSMTLSVDHRVVDGVYAAQFLNEIVGILEG